MSIDLYGIGNALVDSEYIVSEAILSQTGFAKGTMTLVDAEQRQHLTALLEDTSTRTLSKRAGGVSAANTVVTTALLGGSTFTAARCRMMRRVISLLRTYLTSALRPT